MGTKLEVKELASIIACFIVFCLVVFSIISSCNDNKETKKREQEMFNEYPTLPGDVMWDVSIIVKRERLDTVSPAVRDTAIIVKNGDEYWRVKKDGSRQCVKYFKYRR